LTEKCLADLAQEVDGRQRLGPLQVRRDDAAVWRLWVQVKESPDLPRLRSTHSATTSREFSVRSADLPLGSPISPSPRRPGNGPVPGELEPAHCQQLD